MANEEVSISLPGGDEPPIILGSGSKMPATPDMSSQEGDASSIKTNPFSTGVGPGAVKGV